MKVLVVGGGWYGLHIAATLLTEGHDVEIWESEEEVLRGASRQNQLRLHQGFHYLRSHATRAQALSGFARFMSNYGFLTREVRSNLYAVSERESLIDAKTCHQIMHAEGMTFREVPVEDLSFLRGISSAWFCDERLVIPSSARDYFMNLLGTKIKLGMRVEWRGGWEETFEEFLGEFDWFIDATYKSLAPHQESLVYEATLLGSVGLSKSLPNAITLIDGPLFSIYPTDQAESSVSHVSHSILRQFSTDNELSEFLASDLDEMISERLGLMEHHISQYLPNVLSRQIQPLWVQRKLKRVEADARRDVSISNQGRFISVFPGKIDAVFEASDHVADLMGRG